MAERERPRVVVVGVAGIGRTHLQAYRELQGAGACELYGVCDVQPAVLEKARAEFGAPHGFTEYRAALDDPRVDLISLCVPHFLHRAMALQALRAGKHLLLEKPVGMTYGESMEIAEAARSAPVTAGVIFQSRFDPRLRFVREEVLPRLGRIRFASSREYHWRGAGYYAGAGWRGTWKGEGGALFINQCIHGWDVFQWLLGGVDYAYGYWTNLLHPSIETEDLGYGSIRFHGPAGEPVAGKTVATTCLPAPPNTEEISWSRRLPIHLAGEHGEVIASDFRAPRQGMPDADFRMHDPPLDRELRGAMDRWIAAREGEAADHRTNIRAFLDAVRQAEAPPVTLESAAEVQKIIGGIHLARLEPYCRVPGVGRLPWSPPRRCGRSARRRLGWRTALAGAPADRRG